MATSTNSFLVGNNTQTPKSTPQSLLHLTTKPNTITLTGKKTKPVSVRCVSSPTQVQDGATKSSTTGSGMSVMEMRATEGKSSSQSSKQPNQDHRRK
ncbi:hypothetical protein Bca4012_038647 [Brassica carinata]